ncbi:fibro-slime domain-containing protein [Fibrobacter sp. UWT2]|nr:fibro-slime domain-containing protein [Fibrobacter sp. UWT2]
MWCYGFLKKALLGAFGIVTVGLSFAADITKSPSDRDEEPGSFVEVGKKVIRFLTPWTNTSAILFVNGDSVSVMRKVDNYCGWFESTVKYAGGELSVAFKQTVGNKFYGMEGVAGKEVDAANEISLDSIAAIADTLWIRGYQGDAPELYTQYPGVLGDCPTKKLPVMMFDWYDGSRDNHKKYNPLTRDASLCGNRCTSTYGGEGISADFGGDNVNMCWPNSPVSSKKYYEEDRSLTDYNASLDQVIENMVERNLGKNGVPVRNELFDWDGKCRSAVNLNKWFLPETLAVKDGKYYTNATCRTLDLVLDDDGIWRGQMDRSVDSSTGLARGGMFLIDDFQFLDSAKTIPNPYYDSIPSGFAGIDGSGKSSKNAYHNYGMSMKVQAKFQYIPGQYFEFLGDDDVWVYINNKLVVDIGGVHDRRRRSVDLDTLGLIPESTYTFHIFYTERYKVEGNFKMRTSMDLKVDANLLVELDRRENLKEYYISQINKKEALSCDFSAEVQVDTTGGHSTFRLVGGSLVEPEILDVGDWYEGIHITSDSTFAIDSAAIVDHYALAPGHYFIEISLKSDPSQVKTVEIIVPSYSIPSIAYTDSNAKILGTEVSGDTLQIGKWAYEMYPVHISFLEDWAQVNNYNKKVSLIVSNPLIDILDANGNRISKVTLDSLGRAVFYVRANGNVENAVLTAQGAAATASYWKNLRFELPPIPRVTMARFFDRNGDGRGDSLYVKFDKPFDSQNLLDSLQFKFGENFPVFYKNDFLVNGDELVLVSNGACLPGNSCGFGSRQFTGDAAEIYMGSLMTWYTYIDNDGKRYHFQITDDPIADDIGPVIISAEYKKNGDGVRQLILTFSEAILDSTRAYYADMFEFVCRRNGTESVPEKPVQSFGSGNTMMIFYSSSTTLDAVIPTDGDLVRFVPGVNGLGVRDLSNNVAHVHNPWVVITGDQELSNQSPGVVTVSSENPIVVNPATTQVFLIPNNSQTAQEIGDSLGVQGHLIDFDIYKVIQEETKKEIAALDAYINEALGEVKDDTVYNISMISEEEALRQLFDDIGNGIVGEAYGISEEVVVAVQSGVLTPENYKNDGSLTQDDKMAIENLMQKNIDESRDTSIVVVPASNASMSDLFAAIIDGRISKDQLREAGVSEIVIDAIKEGVITADNLPAYRSAELTLMNEDQVKLSYNVKYYSHLGEYVAGKSGSISCADSEIYGEGGCKNNKDRIFLAWNMRSDKGRLVGTGVYIARLWLKLYVAGKQKMNSTRDKLWGVRR